MLMPGKPRYNLHTDHQSSMCSDGQSSVVIVDEGKSQRQSINDKISLQNMETTADESGYNTNFSSKIQNPFGL